MDAAAVERSDAPSGPTTQRPCKARSRISAACVRCQKRKIRCDGAVPACGACRKAGANCVGGGASRDIPRGYVHDLEARIAWLESIVREHVPSVDLGAGPHYQSHGTPSRGPKDSTLSHPQPDDGASDAYSPEDESLSDITHQIGLVSVTSGTDLRYLGPSSGLFFTKFVLAGLGRRIQVEKQYSPDPVKDSLSIPADLLVVRPQDLPSDKRHARWLSQAYFETVHLQFPFLHGPSYFDILEKLYDGVEVGPTCEFQVFMVLAIGATILARRAKIPLCAEGYYASAMTRLDGIFQKASFTGVQCVLLLQTYAMNNPSSGLSLWSLHYHCLAWTIELGLQRNAPGNLFSVPQQELRTRVFWCVYTIDRALCTLMGRPLGLMDEQCDLRLPLNIDDKDLDSSQTKSGHGDDSLTDMSSAIHLFKLARLNSEIKCVLYCVGRQYPPYTRPATSDIVRWKEDILNRLRKWKEEIPRHPEGSERSGINHLCEIKYHELIMLVLRPNPVFQNPTQAALRECFASAMQCSKLYHELYAANTLHYSWIGVHSLFLCVITMFYCVWTPGGVADEVDVDTLMRALKSTSDILSATGEYWPEARRSRDVLDRISTATVSRFTTKFCETQSGTVNPRPPPAPPISANLGFEQATEVPDVDFISPPDFQALQFGNGSFGTGYMSPVYETQADSFTTTDMLSYFMGSGGDGNMNNAQMMGGYYPSVDEVMQNFFANGFRDLGEIQ
ncbi:Fungal Zn2-Cys6 binuclear cluster domain-containing protein [Cladophialophora immunda]|nr:Fungal Zn2-Cys6 binuclear cluster domain-containing protein [Cladophialophora immunda]